MRNHRKYLEKQKVLYNKIGAIPCPALDGELVHFNSHGFKHLIRKNGFMRPESEIRRRFSIIGLGVKIVFGTYSISEYRETKVATKITRFWLLKEKFGKTTIKVVLRKIEEGNIHFFSIMKN